MRTKISVYLVFLLFSLFYLSKEESTLNEIVLAAIKTLPQYKSLSPKVAKFFIAYYELFACRDGCHEPNSYFAEKEGKDVKTIEARFKMLRDADVIKTTVNKYRDPYFTNKSGFITSRKNELDPVFKAQLDEKINFIKEELARRRTIKARYKKVE